MANPAANHERRTLLLTGASRGIGRELVRQYAADDYDVTATCRDPERADELRSVRRAGLRVETVHLNAADPLNLVGIVLPGPRVPAVRTNRVTYVDGLPVTDPGAAAPPGRDDVAASAGAP